MEIERLLKSVSAESPCGPDLEYDADFLKLSEDLESPQERIAGDVSEKEPNWNTIAFRAEALFSRTKDLRVAIWLSRAWTRREGLAGLVSGLHLINDLLTLYWEDIHPNLDSEDDNDPTRRLNVLSEIGDYGILVRDVQNVIILFPPVRISIRDILIVLGKISGTNVEVGYTQAQIEEMFHAQDNAQAVQNFSNLITEALETLQEIRNFLKQKVNEAQLPDFSKLQIALEPILLLCKNAATSSQDTDLEESSLAGEGVRMADKNGSSQGEIRSREDITRVLEKVCKYLERTEPTNPVSLIIRLAQTLMTKNFLEIIEAIPPEDMKVFKKIIDSDKEK
ncbi:type VI secretion system protein TssA [Nitrosomonas sp. Nm84]|uniref:type VI secretion system protein TssA n=1 Tax=Nitrosomonas sp. Nm84 TaxID=200124 RepID=UPI00140485D0|nr:type VI secretion system protein TssA [Nitrosomonas sp. Nm84]